MSETRDTSDHQAQTETPADTVETENPGVELLHEAVAAALAGVGQVLHTHFTHETLTGKPRKYNNRS